MYQAEAAGAQLHLPPHDNASSRRSQRIHCAGQCGLRQKVGSRLKADLEKG